MMNKPTDKQLKYIRDLQVQRYGVPEFNGKTCKDAYEFIAMYKDNPIHISEEDMYMLPDEGCFC